MDKNDLAIWMRDHCKLKKILFWSDNERIWRYCPVLPIFTGFQLLFRLKNMTKIMNKKEIKLWIKTIQLYEWRIAVSGKNIILVRKLPNFDILVSFSEIFGFISSKNMVPLENKNWYVYWVSEWEKKYFGSKFLNVGKWPFLAIFIGFSGIFEFRPKCITLCENKE